MKFLILCSLYAATVAAPGGLLEYGGYGGLGLGHGIGLGGIAIAAPAIHAAPVAVAAPAPVLVQQAPTIVKAIAPAATSSVSVSQVHIQHPSPIIKYAAAPAVGIAQPVIKYAAAPAISVAHPVAVAQPVIKYAAAPSLISGFGGYGFGGHGISLH